MLVYKKTLERGRFLFSQLIYPNKDDDNSNIFQILSSVFIPEVYNHGMLSDCFICGDCFICRIVWNFTIVWSSVLTHWPIGDVVVILNT